jgi:superfamily II DNA helicase RecQ
VAFFVYKTQPMQKHFHAGYITDIVAQLIDKKDNKTLGLLKHVTSFDVIFPSEINSEEQNYNPVLTVLNNVICRGLPTKAPLLVEKTLANALKISQKTKSDFEEKYEILSSETKLTTELVKELLHIVEPKLNFTKEQYDGKLDSHAEWNFINENCKNQPYAKQILQPQRPMFGGGKSVDFAFQSPYTVVNGERKHNFIIEIDGPHHTANEIKVYDYYRDSIAEKHDFKTYREPLTEQSRGLDTDKIFNGDIFNIFEKNYNRSIDEFIKEYITVFTPLAVARIQKTMIEYFLAKPDLLEKETLKLLVIERDVPCAVLAIQSLQKYVSNLNAILEEKCQLKFPKIDLKIITDTRFDKFPELHSENKTSTQHTDNEQFDIIIDHAILRRSGIFKENTSVFENAIKIRSSHYDDTSFGQSRRVYCATPLSYKELVVRNPDGSYADIKDTEDNINFFIKDIFRKTGYRDGQLPIISRALRQLPVIGLLPTGGGKSITFQLSALLQPGLCLVVNPIKSLMEDQVRVLKENWIDSCSYINSSLSREQKVKNQIDFMYGESQFLFVSPERFVMEEFRNIIKNIKSHFGLAITYCVIDEVHCVSEWGHDFRTTYLSLGKNAQKFCATRNENGAITLVGLTATASFDVLADIDRELQIEHNDIANATIMIENTIRPELFFSVTDIGEIALGNRAKTNDIRDSIGAKKQIALNEHFTNLPETLKSIDNKAITASLEHHFSGFELLKKEEIEIELPKFTEKLTHTDFPKDSNEFSSVHFCPHKSGALGVTYLAKKEKKADETPKELFENLNANKLSKGFYMGGSDDDGIGAEDILAVQANQHLHDFLDGRTKHMVCTKAFGMGIDKQDIRAVYHINFSSSPESYIQEAGRAGRDKKASICHLLYSNQTFFEIDRKIEKEFINNLDLTIEERKRVRDLLEDTWFDRDVRDRINGIFDYQYFTKEALATAVNGLGISEEQKTKLLEKISEINADKSVHDFFQDNSFKGVDAEINQIWKLLNTNYGYSSIILKEIVKECCYKFDDIILDLGSDGIIWVKRSAAITIGNIHTNEPVWKATIDDLGKNGKPDLPTTQSILDLILKRYNEYKKVHSEVSLTKYLEKEINVKLNGEDGTLIEKWGKTTSSFDYKFPQNPENEDFIGTIMANFVINHNQLINITKLFDKSIDFIDFIHRTEEHLGINIKDVEFFKTHEKQMKRLYDQQISKGYTARLIYRLMQIGMISDYTIDYRLKTFNCTFEKLKIGQFVENTETFLAKYTSKESAKAERMKLETNIEKYEKEFDKSFLCLGSVIRFTYKEVVAKRKKAVVDLQDFIRDSINRAKEKTQKEETPKFAYKDYWYDYYFKEELYYYFNAKYARKVFNLTRIFELEDKRLEFREVDYSLLNAIDEGKKSDWATFEKFAEVIGFNGGFIADAKMMRGSCRKIWRNMVSEEENKEWTLKLLYAFSTYCLNDNYYIHEANERFVEGFLIYIEQNKGSNYDDFKAKISKFSEFVEKHVNDEEVKKNYQRAKELVLFQAQLEYTNQLISKHQEKLKQYVTI